MYYICLFSFCSTPCNCKLLVGQDCSLFIPLPLLRLCLSKGLILSGARQCILLVYEELLFFVTKTTIFWSLYSFKNHTLILNIDKKNQVITKVCDSSIFLPYINRSQYFVRTKMHKVLLLSSIVFCEAA